MFVRNTWYHAVAGKALKPGTLVGKTLLGEPVLLGRTTDGEAFALRDLCPHRGIQLSLGRMRTKGEQMECGPLDRDQVECPYHGWRFGADGRCAAVPAISAEQDVDLSKVRVRRYPVRERQGLIWIWMGENAAAPVVGEEPEPDHEPPLMPDVGEAASPRFIERQVFQASVEHAVIGLIDPAHGPYVHQSWFWRSSKGMREKSKDFAPSELGFTMLAHEPSKNSKVYALLGGEVATEIAFRLPGVRIEHIRAGTRGTVVGLTTATPLTETTTEVTQTFFWTMGWMDLLKPVLAPFAKTFLGQDKTMLSLQAKGLKHDPRLMLLADPDAQARWHQQLIKAWEKAGHRYAAFENPLKPATLRWRS